MDDLSLRVYLENGSDAMRGGWLELPVAPERLDAFMRGVVGVDDGGGYVVVDHEPGWFGDVLGSDLESFSVSSLNLAARCVAHARDLAVADSVDGDVFLDMLATAAESEDVRFPSGIAALAARAGDVAEFWTEYSLPDSWRAGNSSPDELYGAHVAYGLMGDDAYSSLSYCMDLERLGRDEASNAGVTPGASGFVSDHEPLAPSGPVPDGALDALEAFASGWRPPSAEYRPFDIADIVCEGETVADYTLEGDGTNWGAPVYQCVVDDGFDAGSDVFGVDVLSALEDTLRRIRSARAGMGDFDEVAREVMGVEQFRPEMYDDDYGSVALDLGYVLPSPMASFEPRPVAASAPDGARTPRCSPMIPPRRRGSCDRPASSDAAVAWSFHQSFACSPEGEGRNVRRAVSRRRLQAGDRRTFRPSPSSVPACGGGVRPGSGRGGRGGAGEPVALLPWFARVFPFRR